MIINYLIQCEYFNEYKLNSNVEMVICDLINKIKHAYKRIHKLNNLKINKFGNEFVFEREDPTYFDESIQTDIIENYSDGLKIEFSNDKFNVVLNFYKMRNNKISDSKILNYAQQMLVWLLVVKQYETDDCVKNLLIDVFLTNKKKVLPNLKNEIIGPVNVNTAYTYRCMRGSTSIKLFREEDLMKVFFHETFNTFNMDFLNSVKKQVQNIFNIDSSISIFESYCETWARIFHSLFLSIIQNNMENNNKILKYFKVLMCIESLHSLLQSSKVFSHMNLTIEDAINNTEKLHDNFKEKSHVFSYYFVTAILMLNIDSFINFCTNNNVNTLKFNPANFDNYVILIKNCKNSIDTQKCLNYYKDGNEEEMNKIIKDGNLKMILFKMF